MIMLGTENQACLTFNQFSMTLTSLASRQGFPKRKSGLKLRSRTTSSRDAGIDVTASIACEGKCLRRESVQAR